MDIEKIIEQDEKRAEVQWQETLKKIEENAKKNAKDLSIKDLNYNIVNAYKKAEELKLQKDMLEFELKNIDDTEFTSQVEFQMYKDNEYIKLVKQQKKIEIIKNLKSLQMQLEKEELAYKTLINLHKKFEGKKK